MGSRMWCAIVFVVVDVLQTGVESTRTTCWVLPSAPPWFYGGPMIVWQATRREMVLLSAEGRASRFRQASQPVPWGSAIVLPTRNIGTDQQHYLQHAGNAISIAPKPTREKSFVLLLLIWQKNLNQDELYISESLKSFLSPQFSFIIIIKMHKHLPWSRFLPFLKCFEERYSKRKESCWSLAE